MSHLSYEPRRSIPERRRAPRRALLALAGLALLAAAVPATAAASSAKSATAPGGSSGGSAAALDAVIVAPLGAVSDADSLQRLLSTHGVRARLLYPPGVAVAHVSGAAATRLHAAGFAVLRAGAPPPPDSSTQLRRALRLVTALRNEAQGVSAPLPAVDPGALGGGIDLKEPSPALPPSAPSSGSAAPTPLPGAAPLLGQLPTATELAAFADGSVAVSVIFPQSSGASSTEDWDDEDPDNPGDRRTFLLDRIDLALAWWASYLSGSHLTFVIPPAGTLGAPQTVAVPAEPISQSADDDLDWRGPAMTSLGFPGDSLPERAYGDAVRRANGTDWALTVYVVDSLHDADGMFSGKPMLFAYTYDLFGPYMVLTYDNDGYGWRYFDSVMAHEMGHVFGALDEYYMPPSSGYPSGGDLSSGYLWVRNANAESTGTTDYPCIMRGGQTGVAAYLAGELCPSTQGQVGWRDADHDGIPNVIDTLPNLTLPQPAVSGDGALSAAGTVREQPWPRGGKAPLQAFGHDISIYVPHDVLYRVDGGAWTPATATDPDHAFDQPLEPFALSAGPLAAGHHLLELQATTGGTAALTRDVWVGQTPVELRLAADRGTVRYGSSAVLTVRSLATDVTGTYPVPFLPQISLVRVGGASSTLTTGDDGSVRKSVTPSFSRRYVATFADAGQFTGPASSEEVTVGVRVAISARRAASPIHIGSAMRVWGVVRPAKPRASVSLQESRDSGATWRTVNWGRTDASSRFSLLYRATHRGRVLLRVRYPGDVRNLVGTAAVSRFTVL